MIRITHSCECFFDPERHTNANRVIETDLKIWIFSARRCQCLFPREMAQKEGGFHFVLNEPSKCVGICLIHTRRAYFAFDAINEPYRKWLRFFSSTNHPAQSTHIFSAIRDYRYQSIDLPWNSFWSQSSSYLQILWKKLQSSFRISWQFIPKGNEVPFHTPPKPLLLFYF